MVIQRKTVFASNTKNRSAFVNARKRKKKIPDEIIGGAVAYTTPFPICPLSLCFKTRLSAKLVVVIVVVNLLNLQPVALPI